MPSLSILHYESRHTSQPHDDEESMESKLLIMAAGWFVLSNTCKC